VRDVKAAEAARIARALRLDLAVLLAEPEPRPMVLWRAQPASGARAIEAEFLRWCERQRRVLRLLGQRPPGDLPAYDRDLAEMTYEDADALARQVGDSLDLGVRPARALASALESQFDITIWYLDTPKGCAACTRGPDGAAILVPRGNVPWRRHFDIAHELFHLLTRGSIPSMEVGAVAGGVSVRGDQVEKLANAFAASLLLPSDVLLRELSERSSAHRIRLAELVGTARDFEVSLETLVWRLHNLGHWRDRPSVHEVLTNPRLRELDRASRAGRCWDPPTLPERFVHAGYAATLSGRLSRAQLATYLECGLADLPAVLLGYGIDEDLAEFASREFPVEIRSGDLEPLPTLCEQE